MTQDDPLEVAARALRHRDRSRAEIDRRLARAGIDDDARADALDTLQRVGYVDDGRFASARAAVLAERGFGNEAIRFDLVGQGVGAEQLEAALGALEPELERARALVARLGRTPKTATQLARKGFDPDSIEVAIGSEIAAGEGGVV